MFLWLPHFSVVKIVNVIAMCKGSSSHSASADWKRRCRTLRHSCVSTAQPCHTSNHWCVRWTQAPTTMHALFALSRWRVWLLLRAVISSATIASHLVSGSTASVRLVGATCDRMSLSKCRFPHHSTIVTLLVIIIEMIAAKRSAKPGWIGGGDPSKEHGTPAYL